MTAVVVDHLSWWVGLSREELAAAVKAHAFVARLTKRRKPFLDHVGAYLGREMEPRRVLRHERDG